MRRAAKVDANHEDIVTTLRNMGASVLSLAAIGKGCPDILVGTPLGNWLVEIKDGTRPPSERKLTEDQERFHLLWPGPIDVISSEQEAIDWLNNIRRRGL